MTGLLVALGAAVGAALRFHLSTRLDARLPVGTLAVNVVGSLLLGFLAARALDEQAWALLGTGFCGGLTTYSTFALQVTDLGPRRGVAYAATTVVLAVGAAALGFGLGLALR